MNSEHDRDVQDWFDRSVEHPPSRPFVPAVLEQVRRRERRLRWQRHAALLVGFASICLLLPQLIALLNRVAILPLVAADMLSEQWPLVAAIATSAVYALVRQARRMGLLRNA